MEGSGGPRDWIGGAAADVGGNGGAGPAEVGSARGSGRRPGFSAESGWDGDGVAGSYGKQFSSNTTCRETMTRREERS